MAIICKHFIITGKVQGVFFRDSTCRKASELNITGWVRNTNSGQVELIACGEDENIQKLHDWLWEGPEAARVDQVEDEVIEQQIHQNFSIHYD